MKEFEGKRLGVFEELNKKRALDIGRIKEVTGGGAKISVRGAYESECSQMAFRAKLIVVFNEGNMPKIDVGDEAFMKRLLLIEHRSLFCKNRAVFDEAGRQPFTFMADSELKDRLDRNAVLEWMLEGFYKFQVSGE